MRLTGDIHIHWGHVLRNAAALSVRWWMQGRLWNGDPDFLVVRGPDTAAPPFGRLQEIKPLGTGYGWCAGRHFTQMEARTWALLVHVSGGDVVLSDPLPQLRPAGLEAARLGETADVAMLIRKDKTVNRVASPTKFGEYLLCGLPVIISPNVGESSSIIEEHRLGIVLGGDWIHDPETLPKADKIISLLTCETKQSCREIGVARLSRKAWRDFLVELIRLNSS